MKAASNLNLMDNLIKDCASKCSTAKYGRDLKTIRSRVKSEGLSFLTITLTNFGDDFFEGIERGLVDSSLFLGWKKNKCLPAFLQGFTSRVFDIRTGRRLNEPDVQAIRSVRQICYFFKKINLPCSEKRTARAVESYRKIDRDLGTARFEGADFRTFKTISRLIISSIFPRSIDEWDLIPHHGPGSTMERVLGNSKYCPEKFPWYSQLNSVFSPGLNLYPSEEHYYSCTNGVEIIEDEPQVRVVHVPKTLKTPRIIAMEPVCMQFLQQSIKDFVVRRIEQAKLTKGHVNFTDQSINRSLALSASKTGELATLDLSAASDRVHKHLVETMLEVNPSLQQLVMKTRSPIANVDGELIRLNKFASMGSALCFPMEAMVFYILCLVNRIKQRNILPSDISLGLLKNLSRDVYVYGDDIIIPVGEVESAIDLFRDFYLEISKTKSFYKGRFRESCGMDAFNGEDITPIYLRAELPSRQRQAQAITSVVATANQLHCNGYDRTFYFLKEVVESALKRKLPTVTENCEGLGWVNSDLKIPQQKLRYKKELQRWEVLTFVPSISYYKDEIDDSPALLKCLLKLEVQPPSKVCYSQTRGEDLYMEALAADTRHLSRTPRRGSLTLKTRWVAR